MNNDTAHNQAQAQVSSLCALVAAYEMDWGQYEAWAYEWRYVRGTLEARPSEMDPDVMEAFDEYGVLIALGIDREAALHEATSALLLRDSWSEAELDDYIELRGYAGEYADQDEVLEAVQQDPLSVEYRSGWVSSLDELGAVEEVRIVLCTGGPHVELIAEADGSRVRVLWKDWGTSGEYFPDASERDALATYVQLVAGLE